MLLWRSLLPLVAIVCSSGCKDRHMSAACRAIFEQPPPPARALENSSTVSRSGQRGWAISKFDPGIVPLHVDVRTDSTGFATAALLAVEPGRSELIFCGATDASVTTLQRAVPHSNGTEHGARVRRGDPVAAVGHSGSGDRVHIHPVAMALGPNGVDSMPIRFESCGDALHVWEPRNGSPCRASE